MRPSGEHAYAAHRSNMDQRGISIQRRGVARPLRGGADHAARADRDEGYVSSDEAIALLEVKRETLYAYASRGLVRSVWQALNGLVDFFDGIPRLRFRFFLFSAIVHGI